MDAPLVGNRVRKFRSLRFWVQHGLVYIVDESTGQERGERWTEALAKAVNLYKGAQRVLGNPGASQADRRDAQEVKRAAAALCEAAKEAKRMGDPLDESDARHILEGVKKVQVSLAGLKMPAQQRPKLIIP